MTWMRKHLATIALIVAVVALLLVFYHHHDHAAKEVYLGA